MPDFSKAHQVFLEGIVIECHENRYVFSTRIEHVIEFIRDPRSPSDVRRDFCKYGCEKDNDTEPGTE